MHKPCEREGNRPESVCKSVRDKTLKAVTFRRLSGNDKAFIHNCEKTATFSQLLANDSEKYSHCINIKT